MTLYRINPLADNRDVFHAVSTDPGEEPPMIKVEPTDSIRWCFAHDQELGLFLSICDDEWERNERLVRMGDEAENNCDIGDALLVRVPKEDDNA